MLGSSTESNTQVTQVVFPGKLSEFSFKPDKDNRRSGEHRRGFDRALRTVAVLQTTLELGPLIRLYSREIDSLLSHSSIHFKDKSGNLEATTGRPAKHKITFELLVEKERLGHLTYSRGSAFSEREQALAEYLLCSLVYPLRNVLQYRQALEASQTDPLTGIYNRSVMASALSRETGLSRRHKTSLSLIVLDVDNFKSINDTYGHEFGDELIQQLAGILGDELRKTDLLSRYGGDEFTVLLSNTDDAGAKILATNIRKRIESTQFVIQDQAISVTVSMGIASSRSGTQNEDLFNRADDALYMAKKCGRNRVHLAR